MYDSLSNDATSVNLGHFTWLVTGIRIYDAISVNLGHFTGLFTGIMIYNAISGYRMQFL
jgi:hypothetical protein